MHLRREEKFMTVRNIRIKKEPLFHVVKKAEISYGKAVLLSLLAILIAILAGGIFILAIGQNPFQIYGSIIQGAWRSKIAIRGTIKIAIPLLIAALGITPAFQMKFWNIGAEGQIIMGGIFATYFALFWSELPHGVLLLLMFVAGAIGGGLWGLIPAYFKTKFGTNETLFTLMLNYIALYTIKFLTEGPWRDPESSGFPKIASFVENARLNQIFGVHAGWLIGLLLVVFVFIYIKYTKQGYEISVVGESTNTARYAGMNVKKIIMRTMFLSGAICGIAGMTQVSGAAYTLGDGVAGGASRRARHRRRRDAATAAQRSRRGDRSRGGAPLDDTGDLVHADRDAPHRAVGAADRAGRARPRTR